jgi:hypothetical protein
MTNLTMSRDVYTVTLLANGTLLLVGGEDLGHYVGVAELLNPDTGRLIEAAS